MNGLLFYSFSADTTVDTPDGDVPIAEIEIGDTVIAYNEDNGETGEYTVIDTIVHEDESLAYVTINGEAIETTPWHLFYTSEGWTEAGELQEGDGIVSLGGVYGIVDSVIIVDATQTMYDLTVEEVHTFAVGDGDWVVHNCQTRDFVHGASVESADDIRTNGLSDDKARAASSRSSVDGQSGSFFTIEITPQDYVEAVQNALGFGNRNRITTAPSEALIFKIPTDIYDSLVSGGYVEVRPITGLPGMTETIFKPGGYPTINQGIADGTIVIQTIRAGDN